MATKALKISLNKHKTVVLCVDEDSSEEILQYILDDKVINEFRKIRAILFERLLNKSLYQKLKNDKMNSIFEMRFTNQGRNDRIYCKQITKSKSLYIIMVKLYHKKSQHIPKEISSLLKKIDKYEYEI